MDWWSQPSDPRWWGSALGIFLLSALIVWSSIRYAHRHRLIDQPGRRRSHEQPTPRGGGIGIVIAALAAICLWAWLLPAAGLFQSPPTLGIALALVAAVGWIDDHRSLPAPARLLVQVAAVVILLWPFVLHFASPASELPALAIALCAGIIGCGLLWSINLHNFMDGIDGLLASQAIFVFLCLAALLAGRPHAWQLLLFAAAVAGFLPFNFPRARIFMGDVGSGALGLLIGVVVLASSPPLLLAGAIACSGFVTDATCTLLSRMLRGRRWYSAHREHLYQWLARSGFSHARVVALYMGWNLLIVAPVLIFGDRGDGMNARGFALVAAVYALAAGLWIFGKRWCIRKVKSAAKARLQQN
ncbi:MAG: glycosyltransferase family 4 protein [Rudaea sp.]